MIDPLRFRFLSFGMAEAADTPILVQQCEATTVSGSQSFLTWSAGIGLGTQTSGISPHLQPHTHRWVLRQLLEIAASIFLAWASITEMVKSFMVHQGYEVGLVRLIASEFLLVAAAMAFVGVKQIRSSGDR